MLIWVLSKTKVYILVGLALGFSGVEFERQEMDMAELLRSWFIEMVRHQITFEDNFSISC